MTRSEISKQIGLLSPKERTEWLVGKLVYYSTECSLMKDVRANNSEYIQENYDLSVEIEELKKQNKKSNEEINQLREQEVFRNKEEITVIRDTLMEYMAEHSEFDFIIHNIVSRLNSRIKGE